VERVTVRVKAEAETAWSYAGGTFTPKELGRLAERILEYVDAELAARKETSQV